jgi:hypothetical protein
MIWEEETRHIFKLFATVALQLLDSLTDDDAWKERGIIVGEPVIHFTWGEHEGQRWEPSIQACQRSEPAPSRPGQKARKR